ncbi:hypothetical protein QR97_26175 [Streptomyces sp. PBH53]|uniref:peptidase inhibitor family I36 protein n=1 Tax=Streptomyces TaxID=1883 RepID=UPI0006551670|nr:peptidase inhibitor family I36 protein [Streptomyces sp. PBH53]AKN75561.1 hypothetical protein QR97_26175 [Streptomyces sp. PBH53]
MTITKRATTRAGVLMATAAMALGGLATHAEARSANISSWNSKSDCNADSPYTFCLYYSPNAKNAPFRSKATKIGDLGTKKFTGSKPGGGQKVRNNAASAQNGTGCNVGIWYSPQYRGDSNWLAPLKGGNLTSWMRNNEASIAISDHTRCPGIGH